MSWSSCSRDRTRSLRRSTPSTHGPVEKFQTSISSIPPFTSQPSRSSSISLSGPAFWNILEARSSESDRFTGPSLGLPQPIARTQEATPLRARLLSKRHNRTPISVSESDTDSCSELELELDGRPRPLRNCHDSNSVHSSDFRSEVKISPTLRDSDDQGIVIPRQATQQYNRSIRHQKPSWNSQSPFEKRVDKQSESPEERLDRFIENWDATLLEQTPKTEMVFKRKARGSPDGSSKRRRVLRSGSSRPITRSKSIQEPKVKLPKAEPTSDEASGIIEENPEESLEIPLDLESDAESDALVVRLKCDQSAKRIQDLQRQLAKAQQEHKEAMLMLQKDHNSSLEALRRSHLNETQELKKGYESRLQQMQRDNDMVKQLKDKLETRIDTMRQQTKKTLDEVQELAAQHRNEPEAEDSSSKEKLAEEKTTRARLRRDAIAKADICVEVPKAAGTIGTKAPNHSNINHQMVPPHRRSAPLPSPTPTHTPSTASFSNSDETKSDNIRKVYTRIRTKYDKLHSVSLLVLGTTTNMDLPAFGQFGQHIKTLKNILEENAKD